MTVSDVCGPLSAVVPVLSMPFNKGETARVPVDQMETRRKHGAVTRTTAGADGSGRAVGGLRP